MEFTSCSTVEKRERKCSIWSGPEAYKLRQIAALSVPGWLHVLIKTLSF